MNKLLSDSPATGKLFFRREPITSIAGLMGIFFASQIAAAVLISVYPGLKSWTADEGTAWLTNSVSAQFIYILLAEVFSVWLVFWVLKQIRVARKRIGLVKPVITRDVVYALSGYAVYFVAYLVVIIVASNLTTLVDVDQPQQIGFKTASGSIDLLLVFLSLAVLPPIAEEIMFRGYLFTGLRAKYSFRISVVITSVLFGIAHLQFDSGAPLLWVAAMDTFILSAVLCYLREKTGSLWPPILLHALKNSIAFIVLFHAKF